jgi:hypothetical protein
MAFANSAIDSPSRSRLSFNSDWEMLGYWDVPSLKSISISSIVKSRLSVLSVILIDDPGEFQDVSEILKQLFDL